MILYCHQSYWYFLIRFYTWRLLDNSVCSLSNCPILCRRQPLCKIKQIQGTRANNYKAKSWHNIRNISELKLSQNLQKWRFLSSLISPDQRVFCFVLFIILFLWWCLMQWPIPGKLSVIQVKAYSYWESAGFQTWIKIICFLNFVVQWLNTSGWLFTLGSL